MSAVDTHQYAYQHYFNLKRYDENLMKKKYMIIAAAVLFSVAAYALPNRAFERIYYSDASKTQVVGTLNYMCGRRIYQTGTISNYFDNIDFGSCSRF